MIPKEKFPFREVRGPWQKASGVTSESYISCSPLRTELLVSLGYRLGQVTRNSSQLRHRGVTAIWHLPMKNCVVRIIADHHSPWLHSTAISPGYSVSRKLLQCSECSVPYIIPQRSKAIRQRNNILAVLSYNTTDNGKTSTFQLLIEKLETSEFLIIYLQDFPF